MTDTNQTFTDNPPTGDEIVDAVQRGDLTSDEAADLLQQAERRRAAEEGPTLDTDADGLITTAGPGAGQGMAKQQTGGAPRKRPIVSTKRRGNR